MLFEHCIHHVLAAKVFGRELVTQALARVSEVIAGWGYSKHAEQDSYYKQTIGKALLINRSPFLEDLTAEVLLTLYQSCTHREARSSTVLLSRVLVSLGVISHPLPDPNQMRKGVRDETVAGISRLWLSWSQRWDETSTLNPATRKDILGTLLKAGRWLAVHHPDITAPAHWTREVAAEFIAEVNRMQVGQWTSARQLGGQAGKPLTAKTRYNHIACLRIFFRDCQEWGWITRRFDPRRSFATPRSIRALIAPDPRVIADDVWAKLLWAGLNLTEDDIPAYYLPKGHRQRCFTYPCAMVRAMVHVWLLCGLRKDEFCRLRTGCVRWQRDDLVLSETEGVLPKEAICWLDVPVNKTNTAFTKPVDRLVGESISAWERVRPEQPRCLDPKTGEMVHYLFSYRGNRIGEACLNQSLIPMLCRKAGVPTSDARGRLTSHRARATMASMLHNAKEGMTLFEVQAWLGHRSIESTKSYVKTSPTKLAAAFAEAGYFERNLRSIKVLIDKEIISSGAASAGEAWKYYDLGHGYCAYDFFDQCPHRMACARCSYYIAKDSSKAQMIEGKGNLLRMRQEIPLTEEERAAVEDGIEALEKLIARLADVPTPDGQTPTQLVKLTKSS